MQSLFKRIPLSLLTLLLVLFVAANLAACGGGSEPEEPTPSTTTQPPATTPAATSTPAPADTSTPATTPTAAPAATQMPTPAATATPTPSPTPVATPEPTAVVTPMPASTPEGTATARPTPEPMPTPTPTPGPTATPTTEPSLDGYLASVDCGSFWVGDMDPETNGDLTALWKAVIERMSSMVPPAEVTEWHQATLASFETLEAAISLFPEDDKIDFLTRFAISEARQIGEADIQAAEESMSEVVRQKLVEDGCVDDPDATPTATPVETPTESSDDHGNDINSATAVAVGEAVEGYLGNPDRNEGLDWGNKDAFVVQVEGGHRYVVVLSPLSISYDTRDPGQDPRIAVYDSAGHEIARHGEDSAIGQLAWQAESAGKYYVVLGDGGSTGSYTLTISEDDHANTLADATPVTVGVSAEGVVNYENDTDLFVFEAEAGETYKIDVSLGSLSDSWLTLSDSQDDVLAYGTPFNDALNSIAWWQSPSSGRYYVTIGGVKTGSYTLTISLSDIIDDHGNDFNSATAITVGESKEGAVDYEGDVDLFVFDTAAGEVYEIILSLGSLTDSRVGLWDSQQFLLASNDDYDDTLASRVVVDAPRSGGSYYVGTAGTGTGSYTLTISLSSLPDDHGGHFDTATSVMVGDSVEGAVDYEGDFDWFVFEAVSGEIYQIDVALGSLLDSEVWLFGSNLETFADNDDYEDTLASRITWEAPSSGSYYVVTAGGNGTGSYTLTITGDEQ